MTGGRVLVGSKFIPALKKWSKLVAYSISVCGANAMALAEHEIAMATGCCVLMRARVRGMLCCRGYELVTCEEHGTRRRAVDALG